MTHMEAFVALTQNDFLLTDEELNKINSYFSAMAQSHVAAGEDASQSVSVTFDFMSVFGRTVTAHFDGAFNGQLISDESEAQADETTNSDAHECTVNNSGEQQLAKHGFFISDDIQGSPETDDLANTFSDLIKSMQDGNSDKG